MEGGRPPLERESSLSRLNRALSAGVDMNADKENVIDGKGRYQSSTASSRKKESAALPPSGRGPAPVAEEAEEAPAAGYVSRIVVAAARYYSRRGSCVLRRETGQLHLRTGLCLRHDTCASRGHSHAVTTARRAPPQARTLSDLRDRCVSGLHLRPVVHPQSTAHRLRAHTHTPRSARAAHCADCRRRSDAPLLLLVAGRTACHCTRRRSLHACRLSQVRQTSASRAPPERHLVGAPAYRGQPLPSSTHSLLRVRRGSPWRPRVCGGMHPGAALPHDCQPV